MLKYIKKWIDEYKELTEDFHQMGYFTVSNGHVSYTYIDKEMFKKYHDRQKPVSKDNKQSKK